MFGMLSGSNCNRNWRRVYAGLCRHQHKRFGVRSVMFLSYEAMFLYLLGVDAGVLSKPPESAPGCCKLRTKFPEGAWLDERAGSFCAAFGLVLARVKLEDDVRDDNSWLARSLLLLYRKPFRAATRWFEQEVPGLAEELTDFLQAHLELEQAPSQTQTMGEYVRPTASAFGAVYAAFAELIGADAAAFRAFGADVGAMIISADCAIDWERDRAKGQFNPLPDRAAVKASYLYAMDRLSNGLWRCEETLQGTAGMAVLQHAFEKISRRRQYAMSTFAGSRMPMNAGVCDCIDGCDAGFCFKCDSGGCGCGNCGECFSCVSCTRSGGSCNCCHELASVIDCVETKQKNRPEHNAPDEFSSDLVGLPGVTRTPLSPYGIVEVGEQELPARSAEENLPVGASVIVVDQTDSRVVVRRSD